jgi:hypothetical protein
MARGLISEQPAARNEEVWREAEDGGRLKLVITDAGLAAIGVGTDEGAEAPPATASVRPKKHKSRSRRSATGRKTKTEAPPAGVRPDTRQALLIDLLRRKDGATIGEIVDAIGWRPHSARGAISGTLKKKLGLTVECAVVDDRGRVYRIVGRG